MRRFLIKSGGRWPCAHMPGSHTLSSRSPALLRVRSCHPRGRPCAPSARAQWPPPAPLGGARRTDDRPRVGPSLCRRGGCCCHQRPGRGAVTGTATECAASRAVGGARSAGTVAGLKGGGGARRGSRQARRRGPGALGRAGSRRCGRARTRSASAVRAAEGGLGGRAGRWGAAAAPCVWQRWVWIDERPVWQGGRVGSGCAGPPGGLMNQRHCVCTM